MSIEFKMTFKELKRSLKIYEGYYRTGRIKRMRKGESKCNCYATYFMHKHRILRRVHGTSIVIPRNDPNFYEKMLTQLTRWNRH